MRACAAIIEYRGLLALIGVEFVRDASWILTVVEARLEWLSSQNGLVCDCPQRHSRTGESEATGTPRWSTTAMELSGT